MDPTPAGGPLDSMNELFIPCTCGQWPFGSCFACQLCFQDIEATAPAPPDGFIYAPWFETHNDDRIDAVTPEPFEFGADMEPVFGNHIDAPSPETLELDMDMELLSDDDDDDNDDDDDAAPPVPPDNPIDTLLTIENIHHIRENETTVQHDTIRAYIEGVYIPGDRTGHLPRRQARRKGGFHCDEVGCDEVFDRQCDLNRHSKKHLHRRERPHVCPTCHVGFLHPKDLRRHDDTHKKVKCIFRCEHADCTNHKGFSRKDNLRRHQRKHQRKHPRRQHPPQ